MELRLSEELEQDLYAEAAALGTTAEEVSAQVLARHIMESRMRFRPKADDRAGKIDAHIAWLKSRDPNYAVTDPFVVDWQAVKAEGRRY